MTTPRTASFSTTYETRRGTFVNAAERIKQQGIVDVVRAAAAAIPKELGARHSLVPSISCCRTGG